jgi:hypothetical protein
MEYHYRYTELSTVSVEGTNMEASINMKINHCPVIDRFPFISEFKNETAQQDSREDLHLPISKFLPKTYPWPCLLTSRKADFSHLVNEIGST